MVGGALNLLLCGGRGTFVVQYGGREAHCQEFCLEISKFPQVNQFVELPFLSGLSCDV